MIISFADGLEAVHDLRQLTQFVGRRDDLVFEAHAA